MSRFILMAEDDPDIQLVARLALKRAGFRVEAVDNGRRLLERLKITLNNDERPDAVLLDWMMPEMDGPETCRRLKADASSRDIPVIFMTAAAPAAIDGTLGAIGHIVKPFDPLRLGEQVATLLPGGVA